MSYDYSGSFCAAWIIRPDGQRIPLWFRSEQEGRVESKDRCFLTGVTVKQTFGDVPKISATLVPTYDEGIEFLDSALIEFGEARLQVQFGYTKSDRTAQLSPVYSGLMLKPDVNASEEFQITLNAQGLNSFSPHNSAGVNVYNDTLENVMVAVLTANSSRRITVDFENLRSSETHSQKLGEQKSLSQSGYTDWELFNILATELATYYTIVMAEDGAVTVTLYQRFAQFRDDNNFKGTLYFRGAPNGEYGPQARAWPIKSVSTSSVGQYLPSADLIPTSVVNRGIDSQTGQVATESSDSSNTPTHTGGEGDVPQGGTERAEPPNTETGRAGMFVPGVPADQIATDQRKTAFEQFQNGIGIQLEIETLGIPDLQPGNTFAVKGLGRRIDGPTRYMVIELEHTVGTSTYMTKMKLISNIEYAVGEQSENRTQGSRPQPTQSNTDNPNPNPNSTFPRRTINHDRNP